VELFTAVAAGAAAALSSAEAAKSDATSAFDDWPRRAASAGARPSSKLCSKNVDES